MPYESLQKTKARQAAKMIRAREAVRNPQAGVELIKYWPDTAQRVGIVAGYVPFYDEIDPLPLMNALAQDGHKLCLPRTPRKGYPLSFHHYTFGDTLESGPFGTKQPRKSAPGVTPDIVLTPLLAYSRAGHRLGYGGGFYDRTLDKLRQDTKESPKGVRKIFACGLAYSGQEVPMLPTGPFDQKLDGVLSDTGFMAFI